MCYALEVCCYSIESVIAAKEGGAQRIELCSGQFEGGTTPSTATIEMAKEYGELPVNVIIRPRGGDFLYNEWEMEQMLRDIKNCRQIGADGVVIGMLKADGSLDVERMNRLVEQAGDLEVTLHRAFDMCNNAEKAIEQAKQLGFTRILTSGCMNTAQEGKENLAKIVQWAGSQLKIMAGSGVNENSIEELIKIPGLNDFHMSGNASRQSLMEYQNPNIAMGKEGNVPEYEIFFSDVNKIKQVRETLNKFQFV